jgi:hypothetical protein
MRSHTRNWIHTGLVIAVLAGSQTGCRSGWKMPGTDMFSWGRKPSESTLVGSGPSVSTPGAMTASAAPRSSSPTPSSLASTPTSPASRSTPNAVNSTAVNPGAATRPAETNFGGYGPNAMNPYAATASAAPAPGAAAAANGYATGAYATNQVRAPMGAPGAPYGQPGLNYPPSGVQPSAAQATAPQMQSPQIPLAQGAGPSSMAAPNYSYPANGPGMNPAAVPTYGGAPAPRGPATMANAPSMGLPPAAVPNGYPMNPPPASNGLPMARAQGPSGLPAVPVSTGSNLPPGLPSNAQMPMAYGGTAPSSMPVMSAPSSMGSAPYRPGSVGRSTPYDFSNQGPGAPTPGVAPTTPASSFPRTATDPSSMMNR